MHFTFPLHMNMITYIKGLGLISNRVLAFMASGIRSYVSWSSLTNYNGIDM